MHIGLIGGIGIAATVVYYQRLAAAMAAKGARLRLTISHGDVHTLIANNLADRREPQAEIFARQVGELRAAGACSQPQRQLFLDAGRRMVDEQGAEAIVLAGTDLNLAFDGQEPGYRVIDALDVHVELLARLASGETSIEEATTKR